MCNQKKKILNLLFKKEKESKGTKTLKKGKIFFCFFVFEINIKLNSKKIKNLKRKMSRDFLDRFFNNSGGRNPSGRTQNNTFYISNNSRSSNVDDSLGALFGAMLLSENIRRVVNEPLNSNGVRRLHVAAAKGELDDMKTLIEAGADINIQDIDGDTPLNFAILKQQRKAANFLMLNGCYVDR